MPTSLSAAKRVRQNEKRRISNRNKASALKTAMKRLDKAVAAGNKDEVKAATAEAYKRIDKAAVAHVIHKNTAARRKSLVARKAAALK
jgi:small subunit ribosomal protein S20